MSLALKRVRVCEEDEEEAKKLSKNYIKLERIKKVLNVFCVNVSREETKTSDFMLVSIQCLLCINEYPKMTSNRYLYDRPVQPEKEKQ